MRGARRSAGILRAARSLLSGVARANQSHMSMDDWLVPSLASADGQGL